MKNYDVIYENLLIEEIKAIPEEYLSALLGIIRLFRESVRLGYFLKRIYHKSSTSFQLVPELNRYIYFQKSPKTGRGQFQIGWEKKHADRK